MLAMPLYVCNKVTFACHKPSSSYTYEQTKICCAFQLAKNLFLGSSTNLQYLIHYMIHLQLVLGDFEIINNTSISMIFNVCDIQNIIDPPILLK